MVFFGELRPLNAFKTSSSWLEDRMNRRFLLNQSAQNNQQPLKPSLSQTPITTQSADLTQSSTTPTTTISSNTTQQPKDEKIQQEEEDDEEYEDEEDEASLVPETPKAPEINGFCAFIGEQFTAPDLDLEPYNFLALNVVSLRNDSNKLHEHMHLILVLVLLLFLLF